jgi:hypothetical protein
MSDRLLFQVHQLNDLVKRSGYDPYRSAHSPFPERNYVVGLHHPNGKVTVGGLMQGADYHPIYPLEAALLKAGQMPYSEITILSATGENLAPDVMYRDRQALLNSQQAWSDALGSTQNVPVRLVSLGQDGAKAWETDPRSWLPLPFSVDNFGSDFREQVRTYNQSYFGSPQF